MRTVIGTSSNPLVNTIGCWEQKPTLALAWAVKSPDSSDYILPRYPLSGRYILNGDNHAGTAGKEIFSLSGFTVLNLS